MTYELLNSCHVTHLNAKDNDMTSNFKGHSYYQIAFFNFVIILKCHVINFHGVTCKVMWMSCQLNHFIWLGVIKDALDYKSDMYKKTIQKCSTINHTWPKMN
jgi:hypothetical protein